MKRNKAKNCPYCGSPIKVVASKCYGCDSVLETRTKDEDKVSNSKKLKAKCHLAKFPLLEKMLMG